MARKYFPDRTEHDSPAMTACLDWCLANGITYRRTSQNQIKVQHLNFWPDSETVQFDGKRKLRYGTFERFKNLALQNRDWRRKHLSRFAEGVDD